MLRASHILQLTAAAMLGLGVVMVHSAGMSIGDAHTTPLDVLTSRNAVYAGVALLVMMIASRVNVHQLFVSRSWTNPMWWLLAGSLALAGALLLLPNFGTTVNGATRWVRVDLPAFTLSFQPSELVKWSVIPVLAWWCARRRGVMHRFFDGLLPPLMLVGFACTLVVIEDLGTAALIAMASTVILIAGGARLWQLGLLAPAPLAAMVYFIAVSDYRRDRILSFLHLWDDPQGKGYHPIQSMLAIAQGGPAGRGLGAGVQKFGYLPEDTTDFIFAIICEELGVAGALLVAGLFLTLVWAGVKVISRCNNLFGKLLAIGVIATVGLQALINLAVVTVLAPTKGIALPLISAGGTGWVLTAGALGLVAAIDHAEHLRKLENPALDPDDPSFNTSAAAAATAALSISAAAIGRDRDEAADEDIDDEGDDQSATTARRSQIDDVYDEFEDGTDDRADTSDEDDEDDEVDGEIEPALA